MTENHNITIIDVFEIKDNLFNSNVIDDKNKVSKYLFYAFEHLENLDDISKQILLSNNFRETLLSFENMAQIKEFIKFTYDSYMLCPYNSKYDLKIKIKPFDTDTVTDVDLKVLDKNSVGTCFSYSLDTIFEKYNLGSSKEKINESIKQISDIYYYDYDRASKIFEILNTNIPESPYKLQLVKLLTYFYNIKQNEEDLDKKIDDVILKYENENANISKIPIQTTVSINSEYFKKDEDSEEDEPSLVDKIWGYGGQVNEILKKFRPTNPFEERE